MSRLRILSEQKSSTPDWAIVPHVDRSADKYERHNQKKPKKTRRCKACDAPTEREP